MDTKYFAYDVFISYRHTERDRAWAKWLLEALETFRVPKVLQQRGFPARIGKVFRDEDELPTSADLSTNIQQALENSRFLVVICSKDTPSSLWVDKEVATFRKLGRGDHIIPLLVEGDPGTSFPASLQTLKKPVKQADGSVIESDETLEPIAADVRERRDEKLSTLKRLSLLRILAAILGCAFDDLRQRDHERQARKQRIQYSVAAILALFIVGCSLYWWDYNRLKVEYYNTMVYRWGVPEGIGKLNRADLKQREHHVTVMRRKNQVVRVRNENRYNNVEQYSSDEGDLQVQYNIDGTVEKIYCRDDRGHVEQIRKYEHWTTPGRSHPDSSTVDLLNEYMMPLRQTMGTIWYDSRKSDITRHTLIYDKTGLTVRDKYLSVFGTPKSDPLGCYGKAYQLATNGLPSAEWSLDANGERTDCLGNTPVSKMKYDRQGNTIVQTYWSLTDTAVIHPTMKYHCEISVFDAYGNLRANEYYGCRGEPVVDQFGYHREVYSHDAAGRSGSYFKYGTKGELVLGFDGFAGDISRKDSLGRTTEKWYYGTDSALMVRENIGLSGIKTTYGFANDSREEIYLDKNGKPVKGLYGVYRAYLQWNKSREGVEQHFTDSLSQPMRSDDGYAKMVSVYDQRNQKIEWIFYDVDNKPLMLDNGYAHGRRGYDEKGNMIEETYYDDKDKPVIRNIGYFKKVLKYDEWGNITDEYYYGLNGEPVNNSKGYAHIAAQYDGNGDIKQATYYNKNGGIIKPKEEKKISRNYIIF